MGYNGNTASNAYMACYIGMMSFAYQNTPRPHVKIMHFFPSDA